MYPYPYVNNYQYMYQYYPYIHRYPSFIPYYPLYTQTSHINQQIYNAGVIAGITQYANSSNILY